MTKTESVENRKYPRHKIFLPAHLEMFDGSFPVNVVEISLEGLRINSTSAIEPETHVAIRIDVGREIVFHGQVVWVTDKHTPEGQLYTIGIWTDALLDRGAEIIDVAEREIVLEEILVLF
jgi:hypothetical protein